jgi:hypothetical protein
MPALRETDFPVWPAVLTCGNDFTGRPTEFGFVWERASKRKEPFAVPRVLPRLYFDRLRGFDPGQSTRTMRVYATLSGALLAFLLAVDITE